MKGSSRRGHCGWLASLLVTVLAIAPLLAIFHQASVRHAVCEHGDLIEPEARADHHPGSLDEALSSASVDSFQADASPAVHGHSHCSVGTLAKSAAHAVAPAAVAGALPENVVAVPIHREVAHARPALSSAPKTSPPIASALS